MKQVESFEEMSKLHCTLKEFQSVSIESKLTSRWFQDGNAGLTPLRSPTYLDSGATNWSDDSASCGVVSVHARAAEAGDYIQQNSHYHSGAAGDMHCTRTSCNATELIFKRAAGVWTICSLT